MVLTHACAAKWSSNHIMKFSHDSTVTSFIRNNDESAYKEEMEQLTDWCRDNSLSLKVNKMKKITVDSGGRRNNHCTAHQWKHSGRVKVSKFLGVYIIRPHFDPLIAPTQPKKTKANGFFTSFHPHHFLLGDNREHPNMLPKIWQKIVRTVEKIIKVSLQTTDTYINFKQYINKATSSHGLFTLFGRRYWSIHFTTTRFPLGGQTIQHTAHNSHPIRITSFISFWSFGNSHPLANCPMSQNTY